MTSTKSAAAKRKTMRTADEEVAEVASRILQMAKAVDFPIGQNSLQRRKRIRVAKVVTYNNYLGCPALWASKIIIIYFCVV